jgi:GGDEF domain-containing protein
MRRKIYITSLTMLGTFAIMIGLWKLTDNEVMYLLFPEQHAMYLIPCLLLHLGMVPFVLFVRELNIGVQAKHFEQKAYHDQLTGLNNRMAYADYTNRDEFSPHRSQYQ